MITYNNIAVMEQSITCPKCEQEYSEENPPKNLINCDHIICLNCLSNQILCPIDRKRIERRKYSIEAFETNENMLRKVTGEELEQEREVSVVGKEEKEAQQNTEAQGNTTEQVEEDDILTVEADKGEQITPSVTNSTESEETQKPGKPEPQSLKADQIRFEMCLLHGKPAELICLQDKCLICANCGLFGEHKHHSLLAYDTFATDFSSKAEQCLTTLTLLNSKEAQIYPDVIQSQVDTLIRSKKQSQIKNIKRITNDLFEVVKSLEKQMMEKLEKTLTCKKSELMSSLCFEALNQKKQDFENDFSKMQRGISDLLQMQNIEDYLGFVDENHPKSYLNKEGEYLIIEMDNHLKSFNENARKTIDSIAIKPHSNPQEIVSSLISLESQAVQAPVLKVLSPRMKKYSPEKPIKEVKSLPKDTPSRLKKCDDDLLIRGSHSGQVKRSPSCTKLMSPIRPIPSFEQTFDSKFREQYRHSIITPREESKFLKSNSTTLQYHKPIARFSMATTKPGIKKETDISLVGLGKPRSNNSSHVVEREILNVLNERNSNRRKKKLDLPPKYAKIYEDLQKDRVDVLDLGGAGLGDAAILSISQLIPSRSRLKSVKLMNNKLTDDILPELLSRCQCIHSLNLSYNCFTERSLHVLQRQVEQLGGLTNITLSNNKIVLRSVKDRLEALKRRGLKISL